MERTNPLLYHSGVREFSDLSNFRPNTTNPNCFRQPLKSSFVDQKGFEPISARSTSSRDQNYIKPLNRFDTKPKLPAFKLPLQSINSTDVSSNKQYSNSTTPRNLLAYSDQIYPSCTESNAFTPKKPSEPIFNRSLKSSVVSYQNDAPFFGGNEEKQNSSAIVPKRFRDQKSNDKDKLSFRDSLGSLSKQIKNTLKLPIKIETSNPSGPVYEEPKPEVVTPKKSVRHVRSRAGSIRVDENEPFRKQQKAYSFYASNPNNRVKRPNNLDLNMNNQANIEKQEIQKNICIQIGSKPQKYTRKNIETQRLPLGRSTITSNIFQNDNQLKHSYVVEPLTPQLKSGKYDSFESDKEKPQKPKVTFFESNTSIKPQAPKPKKAFGHTRISSIVTNLASNSSMSMSMSSTVPAPKVSFVSSASCFESNKFTKDRDSLSSRERSSFGKEFTLNDFQLGSVKGEGRFGKFYPAVHKKTGFLVGIKEIKKESLRHMLDQFIQELKIQSHIDHPNIVKLYGYFCTKENFYLILEYMEEGSLFSFIKKSKKLQEIQASTKLKQICSAVEYLHENEILHRDIKPENIVMTCDVCKLCDFGWAVYSSTRRKTYCGTLDYVCPQILEGDSYDACVDIWAIGVLAYEMIVGKAPFYNISRKETMKKIMDCNFEIPKQVSKGAKDFIARALNKNPQYRESIHALSKHEFLN